MSVDLGPIALAHEPPFTLGALVVRPSTRELVHPGAAAAEVLEPRVMQVLVALHNAGGAIVSRDDLTRRCWDGRVVGEDAINRVISRLRRSAEASGAFRIETVTKVGYRLLAAAPPPETLPAPIAPASLSGPVGRRPVIAAALTAGVAALGGAGWWWTHRTPGGPPAEVAALVAQARTGLYHLDQQSGTEAIGLLRRSVELRPDYADGWGQLAFAYAFVVVHVPGQRGEALARARAAAARALALDPANPYARLALALARSYTGIGDWLNLERIVRDGLARDPDDELMLLYLSGVYTWTGRCRESAAVLARVKARNPPEPGPLFSLVIELWGSDQLEQADREMDEAYRFFPLNFAIWTSRLDLLIYSGRADQALTMVRAASGRPPGTADWLVTQYSAVAQAMLTRAPADVAAALAVMLPAGRRFAGTCVDAISFCSAVGRLEDGFALLDGLYFDRPGPIGGAGPTVRVAGRPVRADRNTLALFLPPMAAMRADRRFALFVRALGLEDYWRRSGVQPDYRRG